MQKDGDAMHTARLGPALRLVKLALALCWAGALVLGGLWLWPVNVAVAGGAVAAGQCVLMWLVADDLFPNANAEVTGFLKFTVALVFWGHLLAAAYTLWPW